METLIFNGVHGIHVFGLKWEPVADLADLGFEGISRNAGAFYLVRILFQ